MYKLGKWRYQNHLGETFSSDRIRTFIENNQLLDFKRAYSASHGRILSFDNAVSEKAIPLVINGDNEEDGIRLRNDLYDITTKDVLARQPGRFYLGDWYLSGYIVESQKSSFMMSDQLIQNSLTFVSEQGTWRKDIVVSLTPQDKEQKSHDYGPPTISGHPASEAKPLKAGLIYPEYDFDYFLPSSLHAVYPIHDYPFDYFRTTNSTGLIVTDAVTASPFTMTIWGPCVHPIVTVNGHQYGVNATIFDGERVIIDSESRTVVKIGRLGEKTNLFNERDKAQSIFELIPPGCSTLLWPGTYGVDLVAHEQRMEPVWTLS